MTVSRIIHFCICLVIVCFLLVAPAISSQELKYPWPHVSRENIEDRIPVPQGFVRVPVKPGKPDVHLYNGEPRDNQSAHVAVIDMNLPRENLQQCADSVIRLRAEYLYSIKDYSSIHFNFTSGDEARFDKYAQGYRPVVAGNFVQWFKLASADSS